jgi:hypothetical protein
LKPPFVFDSDHRTDTALDHELRPTLARLQWLGEAAEAAHGLPTIEHSDAGKTNQITCAAIKTAT